LQRDRIIEEKYEKLADLDARIREIEFTRKSFYHKLRSEIESHLKLVDSLFQQEKDAPDRWPKSTSPPDSRQQQEPDQPPADSTIEKTKERDNEESPESSLSGINDADIDNLVDNLGAEPEQEEKIDNGQSHRNDF
jgi:hypothetical protein